MQCLPCGFMPCTHRGVSRRLGCQRALHTGLILDDRDLQINDTNGPFPVTQLVFLKPTMSRQHRSFLHIFQFVSTNATGVKSSSAALNPVTLPLHKHGLVAIDPLCQAHLRIRSARGEYNTWPFLGVREFIRSTHPIYIFFPSLLFWTLQVLSCHIRLL